MPSCGRLPQLGLELGEEVADHAGMILPLPIMAALGTLRRYTGVCVKGGATACTRFTSVRPQYYPTALVATTERPRTEQWMAPKVRERSITYYRRPKTT